MDASVVVAADDDSDLLLLGESLNFFVAMVDAAQTLAAKSLATCLHFVASYPRGQNVKNGDLQLTVISEDCCCCPAFPESCTHDHHQTYHPNRHYEDVDDALADDVAFVDQCAYRLASHAFLRTVVEHPSASRIEHDD